MSLTMCLILLPNQLSSSWWTWRSPSPSSTSKPQTRCARALPTRTAPKPRTGTGLWGTTRTQPQTRTTASTKSSWRPARGRKCQSCSPQSIWFADQPLCARKAPSSLLLRCLDLDQGEAERSATAVGCRTESFRGHSWSFQCWVCVRGREIRTMPWGFITESHYCLSKPWRWQMDVICLYEDEKKKFWIIFLKASKSKVNSAC